MTENVRIGNIQSIAVVVVFLMLFSGCGKIAPKILKSLGKATKNPASKSSPMLSKSKPTNSLKKTVSQSSKSAGVSTAVASARQTAIKATSQSRAQASYALNAVNQIRATAPRGVLLRQLFQLKQKREAAYLKLQNESLDENEIAGVVEEIRELQALTAEIEQLALEYG